MKRPSEQLEELLGRKLPEGFITPFGKAIEMLDVPEEMINRMLGLNALEAKMADATMAFILAKELNHPRLIKHFSDEIGALIAEQLVKGNYDAPRAISEGLTLFQEGKEFKKAKRRRLSIVDQNRVLVIYYALEKAGWKSPSQSDVIYTLNEIGHPMGKGRVSKIFDALGLRKVAKDDRLAANRGPKKLPMKSD
jgi:hypothetical protein